MFVDWILRWIGEEEKKNPYQLDTNTTIYKKLVEMDNLARHSEALDVIKGSNLAYSKFICDIVPVLLSNETKEKINQNLYTAEESFKERLTDTLDKYSTKRKQKRLLNPTVKMEGEETTTQVVAAPVKEKRKRVSKKKIVPEVVEQPAIKPKRKRSEKKQQEEKVEDVVVVKPRKKPRAPRKPKTSAPTVVVAV